MLAVENLAKTYVGHKGQRVEAIRGVSLEVEAGRLLTLLGPSGGGKTTLLRCIAGLERPDSGRIRIGDDIVFDAGRRIFVPPNERRLGMVFQSYAIWPHMSVFENVAFPLRVSRERRIPRREIRERVEAALALVRLAGLEARAATRLSGGQQQRLALARGLVSEPRLLLLDEPLSNLDAKLREQMRFELKRLQLDLGITSVYVTHDQAEALALSDEIAVIHDGQIEQQGDPYEIYRRPASQFVADFIGTTNLLPGIVEQSTDGNGLWRVRTDLGAIDCAIGREVVPGEKVMISVRPEDIVLGTASAGDGSGLTGSVLNRVFLGEIIDYLVQVQTSELRIRARPELDFRRGETVSLRLPPEKCLGLPRN